MMPSDMGHLWVYDSEKESACIICEVGIKETDTRTCEQYIAGKRIEFSINPSKLRAAIERRYNDS